MAWIIQPTESTRGEVIRNNIFITFTLFICCSIERWYFQKWCRYATLISNTVALSAYESQLGISWRNQYHDFVIRSLIKEKTYCFIKKLLCELYLVSGKLSSRYGNRVFILKRDENRPSGSGLPFFSISIVAAPQSLKLARANIMGALLIYAQADPNSCRKVNKSILLLH